MPTLQGREMEQGEPGMEQTAGREQIMRDLRAPQAQHRHTELHLESPPIPPSFGLEQGWWKAGTLPGCGDSDSDSPGWPWPLEQPHPALLLSCDMAKGSDEVPSGAAGMGNKVSPFQISVLPFFIFLRT